MSGKDKPNYIKVTLGHRRELLDILASLEGRTVSGMINQLVDEALRARGISVFQTVSNFTELLSKYNNVIGRLDLENYQGILNGEEPTESDLIKIAAVLGLNNAEMRVLYLRSFPPNNSNDTQQEPNGSSKRP